MTEPVSLTTSSPATFPSSLTRFIHLFTQFSFVFFLLLTFSTPAWWRAGPFAWWPVVELSEVAGPPVKVGILNFLPIIVGIGWIVEKVLSRQRFTLPRSPVTFPFLALTLWGVFRLNLHSPQVALPQAGAIGLSWLIYFYVVEKRPSLTLPLSLIILLQSGVALGQFFKQQHIGLTGLGELPLLLSQTGIIMLYARDTFWLRAYGLTVSPNLLGAILVINLLLLLPVYHRLSGWRRRAMNMVVAIGLMGLFVSFSRSAWIALGVGVFCYFFFIHPKPYFLFTSPKLLLPVLPCIVLLFAYSDLALSRVTNLDAPLEKRSIVQRRVDYNVAWEMIQQNWLVGVGIGNYELAADQIQGITGSVKVHNIPLLVTAELGIIGLLFWLWLIMTPFWCCFKKIRRAGKSATPLLFPSFFHLWIAMLVMNQFDKVLWFSRNWQPVFLFALILAAMSLSLTESKA